MDNYATFYVVRHGKTEWNSKGWVQGHKDSLLTLEGEEQAKSLGKELSNTHFDLAFSSDLLRAKRTAEIIALERQLEIATTKLLRERSFGKYEGQPYSTLSVYDALYAELADELKPSFKHENVESDEELMGRFILFLRETAITHKGKNILVVTHGNVMYQFLIKVGFGTHKNFPLDAIGNTAYFVLRTDGVDFFIDKTHKITHPTP